MDDDEKFTNRHGHTISAFKEAANDLPEPEYKAVPKPAKHRKRRTFKLSRAQKRGLFITVVILIFVPVLVGEYIRSAYIGDVSAAKNDVKKVFASVLSQQKSSVSSQTLKNADAQLTTIRDTLCPAGFLNDNLAKLYPRAQQAHTECVTYRSNVAALEDLVSTAAMQMTYLEQLQPLLAGVSKPLEDQFAVLSAQQENWQTFVDGLNQLSVPAAFSSVHSGLVTQASAIRDQWIALVQASNTYDSGAFRTARTKLTDSYAAFRTQAAGFSSAVAASQSSIQKAVTVLQ